MNTKKQPLYKLKASQFAQIVYRCPICGGENAEIGTLMQGGERSFLGWCPACTNLFIPEGAINAVRGSRKQHLLSAFLRKLPGKS